MDFVWIILYTIIAYLIGGIPSSVWLGKWYYGIDIRDHGSGTSSHLNVERILGRTTSWLVRIMDICKGILAARMAVALTHQIGWVSPEEGYLLTLTLGLSALMGHIFPIFTRFKGGKGYYMAIGVLLVAHPALTCMTLGVTMITYVFTRSPYPSYLMGAISLPLFVAFTRFAWYDRYLPMLIFAVILGTVLLLTHREPLRDIHFGEVSLRVPKKPFRRF